MGLLTRLTTLSNAFFFINWESSQILKIYLFGNGSTFRLSSIIMIDRVSSIIFDQGLIFPNNKGPHKSGKK